MPTMQTPPGPLTIVDGRQYLYFAGSGYLGLQGHPEVVAAACEAAEKYGTGSATSRTGTGFGSTPSLLLVEERAADLFGTEAALCIPSGYLAAQVLFAALRDTCEVVLLDEHCHYALCDAARIIGKPVVTFRHRDPGDLLEKLATHAAAAGRPLVATDGVFAATGAVAPLLEYIDILQTYPAATLLVDDSHGIGVLGGGGRGLLEHVGLLNEHVNACHDEAGSGPVSRSPRVCFFASLSKAIGGYGGIIPGTRRFVEWMKLRSSVCQGASPLASPLAAAAAEGLRIVQCEPELRKRLHANARLLRTGLRSMGFDVAESPVPIASISLDSAHVTQELQQSLAGQGILTAYFAEYSGLPPQGAVRIAVFATHTEAMVGRLLDRLTVCRATGSTVTV